jgi:hypothetical protein
MEFWIVSWNFFEVLNNGFQGNTFVFGYSVEFLSIHLRSPKNVELIENALEKCKHKSILFQLD